MGSRVAELTFSIYGPHCSQVACHEVQRLRFMLSLVVHGQRELARMWPAFLNGHAVREALRKIPDTMISSARYYTMKTMNLAYY